RFRVENEIDLKVLAFEDEYDPEEGEDLDADPTNELPSYLTSFTTPRVSFDSERDMDPVGDDLLRALVARIHLPTYAESEEDANSRNPIVHRAETLVQSDLHLQAAYLISTTTSSATICSTLTTIIIITMCLHLDLYLRHPWPLLRLYLVMMMATMAMSVRRLHRYLRLRLFLDP
ncbi:hypothetical protein BGZ52_009421, partial [Haplosporangium bisporale]